nr:MAG TPA: virulence associated protein E [Caudoviricetes sp.]
MNMAKKMTPNTTQLIPVRYNGDLLIATGRSRYEKEWKNKTMPWSALLSRLAKSMETPETHAEYMKMNKEQQDKIKDIGGFVGGHLKDGRRKTGYVVARQLLTLDLDFPPAEFWDDIVNNLEIDSALAVYSTHKHTAAKPRYRLIMPLDREVTPDEYEAIARKIAEKIGIDYFDDSTFQPTRLMYWPSHSVDVEPFFQYYDAPFLAADSILAEYPDWTDTSYWPESSRMAGIRKRQADKQGDPLAKKGIVGAFCRTYTITQAIAKFLPDVYTQTAKEDRYTYAAGSTAAGLVVYDGDVFAYSNHSTDPAGGQLCNAFDLVRLHKFGHLDDGHEDKSGRDAPSYKAMATFASEDQSVSLTLANDTRARAVLDFEADLPEDDTDDSWKAKLVRGENGDVKPLITNAVLILENEPALQGIRYNELSNGIEVKGKLPWPRPNKYWRDADDAQLYTWVADRYGVQFPENRFSKALTTVTDKRCFNPLREYVQQLPEWDGVPRADTLLIDYLGAPDTEYTRVVTRKTLVGAIQRVLQPGCKFDTVLVLDGKPGIGKSTLLRKLGGKWFSDSLSLADTRDKTAAEKLQGVWIMEIGEMQGTRKADVDIMKGFISRQVDEYRAAYGRVVERHPRTCIICGTTNSTTGFLRDTTGNRRFWPVTVNGGGRLSVWDMTEDTRAQIWAETMILVAEGETSYLDAAMELEAAKMQREAIEYDDREGEVIDYLETLLPADWYSWDMAKRVDFFQQRDVLDVKVDCTMRRTKVCAREIFCECWGRPKNAWKRQDGYDIAGIMARIPGWEKTGREARVPGYGHQRVYTRAEE